MESRTVNTPTLTYTQYPWATWDLDRPGIWHICPLCDQRVAEPNLDGNNVYLHMEIDHPQHLLELNQGDSK